MRSLIERFKRKGTVHTVHMKGYRRDRTTGVILFLPMALLILLLSFYPVLRVLRTGFYQQSLFSAKTSFVGLQNYLQLLGHEAFWRSLSNNLVFAFGSLVIQLISGLVIALILNMEFYGRGLVRGTVLFSYLVPYVVAALTFRFMLSDATGILSYLIRQSGIGIPASPMGSMDWAMPLVILVNSWKNFPFMVLVFLAQLQSINPNLYEAAEVDGAAAWRKFVHITLPSLMPTIVVVGMLRTIWNFNNFEVIFLLTRGGPVGRTETFPLLIHRFVFGEFSMGRGSALATVVLLVLLLMSILYWRLYENLVEKLH